MQALARRWRAGKHPIAFVPTLGALHEGHLSLIRAARKRVGRRGIVVVSIYVNPTQFGPREDLRKYPRSFERDRKLCAAAGADAIFAPSDREMYPKGFSTFVEETQLAKRLEGASRPGHFRGVCTVVAKLFQIVQPDIAIFGQKDFQQQAVIRQMVCDLNFPIRIVVHPTVRERDGLAMSSRNVYLSNQQRRSAVALNQALTLAQKMVRGGERHAATIRAAMSHLIRRAPEARIDYIELADAQTLEPVRAVARGKTISLLAVYIGKTRLIDNVVL